MFTETSHVIYRGDHCISCLLYLFTLFTKGTKKILCIDGSDCISHLSLVDTDRDCRTNANCSLNHSHSIQIHGRAKTEITVINWKHLDFFVWMKECISLSSGFDNNSPTEPISKPSLNS